MSYTTHHHHHHHDRQPITPCGTRIPCGHTLLLAAISLLLVLLAAPGVWAQESQTPTAAGPVLDGQSTLIPLGVVNMIGITQDADGFFWLGTEGGAWQWNGRTLRKFSASNVPEMTHNGVTAIHVDRRGRVWWGTLQGGLFHYDKATNTVTSYQPEANNPASISSKEIGGIVDMQAFAERVDGKLWIATKHGLNLFDPDTERFTTYFHDPANPASLNGNVVSAVYLDRAGTLYVATENGLCRSTDDAHTFTCRGHDPANPTSLSNNAIHFILEDRQGALWFTTNLGLNRLENWDQGTFTVFRSNPDDPTSLAYDLVVTMVEDDTGNLWITTGGTDVVSVLAPRTGLTTRFPVAKGRFTYGSYKDAFGVIWIMVSGGGLFRYDPTPTPFVTYSSDPTNPKTLKAPAVTEIYDDPLGRSWVVSFGPDGLQRLNRETGELGEPEALGGVAPFSLVGTPDGALWLGDFGNLYRYDPATRQISAPIKIGSSIVVEIVTDTHDPSILWIGTDQEGLSKFESATGTITAYTTASAGFGNNSMWGRIVQDAAHPELLWVGTGVSIDIFNKTTGKVERSYTDWFSTHVVADWLTSSKGEFWAATFGGLVKLDTTTGQVTAIYSAENGKLPAVEFCNVYEDTAGRLWLPARDGQLVRFDPQTEAVKTYGPSDGVGFGSCFAFTTTDTHGGQDIWEGGTNGLTHFNPTLVKDNAYQPPVYLATLTQGGDTMTLPTAPEQLQSITLPWEKPFFEFEAVALDYTRPEKNQYKFMLEGWDKDWFEAGTDNKGRYSGLRGGTYTLKVMGSNNDGLWSDKIAELQVIVTTPWWNTWWFRGGLGTVLIGGLIVGLVARVRISEAQRRKLEQKVQERTKELAESNQQLAVAKEQAEAAKVQAEIASQAKSSFLSNMSHELRTPLNGIMGYAQILGQDRSLTPIQRDGVDIIYNSGSHLLTLINDVLDLSKVEAGKLELIPAEFHLGSFLDGVAGIIRMRAEQRNLLFHYQTEGDLPEGVVADEKRLRQVLINLLGNAAKFTDTGSITLKVTGQRLSDADDAGTDAGAPRAQVRFDIIDTGVGMTPEQLTKIFTAFEQVGDVKRKAEGTGLGLAITKRLIELMGSAIHVESVVGKGSTFWFELTLPAVHILAPKAGEPLGRKVTGYTGKRLTVVAADDKYTNQLVVRNLLEPLGFTVITAEDGRDAIAKVREHRPDILLTDLVMPVMTGFEAVEELRKDAAFTTLPMIALSASVFEQDRQRSKVAGCDDFLAKPVQTSELLACLAKHLQIEWIYAEPEVTATPAEAVTIDEATLTPPAAEHVETLYNLALDGDMEELDQYARRLAQQDAQVEPFAQRISQLAKGFQDQAIVALLNRFRA